MRKVVCVTGASGFIASWLVKLLLRRGYTVNATVRHLSDSSKVAHLNALEGVKERLHLFQANLTEEGSFDDAIDGCDGVFHTASPVILDNFSDPQTELIEPAVKGTLNVLSSCVKASSSIKRVVLTSSMASMIVNRNLHINAAIDETWFSDPTFCEEAKQWYMLSKTLAEKAALKLAEENGMDLVVINPAFVIGPLLQPTLNVTSDSFLSFIKEGKCSGMPGGIFLHVDVRDVADAHILAFENPSANGRYCVVAKALYAFEALDILRHLYPMLNLPMR
ncbi:tetraketide alpha-pyrone reductase 1 [Sesamum indicum]|uniref:Dihydroflavonol 4-reductase n=1 Tax=Sesamum indicum TaxID=4182 RepID=A0A6I9UCJ7_SESIN|nr:tetraketide alpha-pyrone reductase 1 [Sesamum indicum]